MSLKGIQRQGFIAIKRYCTGSNANGTDDDIVSSLRTNGKLSMDGIIPELNIHGRSGSLALAAKRRFPAIPAMPFLILAPGAPARRAPRVIE
jgi:hypothetical protein